MGPVTKKRKNTLSLSVLIALVAAAGAGLYPAVKALSRRMEALRDALIARLESSLGCEIVYSKLSPSLLRSISVEDLVLRDRPGNALLLGADRAEVFLGLARGKGILPRLVVREVNVQGARVDFGVARASGFMEVLTGLQGGGTGLPTLPVRFKIRGSSASFSEGGVDARFDSIVADGSFGDDGIRLRASCDAAIALKRGAEPILGRLGVSGTASRDLSTARIQAFAGAETESLSLALQTFSIDKDGDVLRIRKIEDAAPVDASGTIDLARGTYSADFAFDGLRASSLCSVRGGYAKLSRWLGITGTGKASVSGSFREGAADYAVNGEFRLPAGMLPAGTSISLSLRGDEHAMAVERALASGPDGTASYSGIVSLPGLRPDGLASVDWNAGGARLKGDFIIQTEGEYVSAYAASLLAGETEFTGVQAAVRPDPEASDFTLKAYLPTEGGSSPGDQPFQGEAIGEGAPPPLLLTGTLALGDRPSVEGELALSSFDLGPAYILLKGLLGLPGGIAENAVSSLKASSVIYFGTNFDSFTYNAPQLVLAHREKAGDYGVFSVSGSGTSLSVSRFSLFWNGVELSGDLSADFSSPDMSQFSSALNVRGQRYAISGEVYGKEQLYLRGSHGLELHLSHAAGEALFSLSMREMPLPLAGFTPLLSIESTGRYRSLNEFAVVVESGRLEQTNGLIPSWAALSFGGLIDPRGARFDRLSFEDAHSRLEGMAEAAYSRGQAGSEGSAYLDLAAALSGGAGERYGLKGRMTGERMDVLLTAESASLSRLGVADLKGSVNAIAEVSGDIRSPRVAFTAALSKASILGSPVEAKASGSFTDGLLSFKGLKASYLAFGVDDGRGSYAPATGELSLDSGFRMAIGEKPLTSLLSLRGDLTRGDSLSPSLSGELLSLSFGPVSSPSWPFSAEFLESGMAFRGGGDNELAMDFRGDGSFSIRSASPLPIAGRVDGTVKDGLLHAEAPDFSLDFAKVWTLFGPSAVSFTQGRITGSLSLSGSVNDPVFNGKGRAEGVSGSVPDFLPGGFGPFSSDILVVDNVFSIPTTLLPSGKGGILSSVDVAFERWVPATVNVKAATTPGTLVDATTRVAGVDIGGKARFDLDLLFQRQDFTLKGTVFLDEGSILIAPLKDGTQSGPQPYPPVIDLGLAIGKRVEFLWPTRSLPYLRAALEPSTAPLAIYFDGVKDVFSMKGTARIRGGEVSYFRRNFYLKEGRLAFNESKRSFDPFLSFRAEMRERDDSGPVTIILRMDDKRLSEFSPTLESVPSRPQNDLLAMLGEEAIGFSADEAKDMEPTAILARTLSTVGGATGDLLAQSNIVRKFEGNVRDALNLDMFSIRSTLVQNILIGATLPEDIDRRVALGDYFDGTTISAGKYLGSDLFFQGIAQIRRDDDSEIGNVGLFPEFLIELNTPFFRLLYSFAPEWDHRDSLFIGDQSIGVFWSIPY